MSYHGRTCATDGRQIAYHVQAGGRCGPCQRPVGLGTCDRCTSFAATVEDVARAAYRQFDAQTVARLNARDGQEGTP